MRIEANPAVDPQLAHHAEGLIRRDVLPALRGVIGPALVLPAVVHLVPGSGSGVARMTLDTENGAIAAVGVPAVCIEGGDIDIRYVAAHELAHVHEATMRRRLSLPTASLLSSVVWTEYYAHRIAWRAGFGEPRIEQALQADSTPSATEGAAGTAREPEPEPDPEPDSRTVAGHAYWLAWGLAEADEDHEGLLRRWRPYPLALERVNRAHQAGHMHNAFRRFPRRWPPVLVRGMAELAEELAE